MGPRLATGLAMVAFAANSVLCRMALGDARIDAVTFTTVRLASGALMLALLVGFRPGRLRGTWTGAAALALYAFPFSLAYVDLSTGTGALLLFGMVQATMLLAAWRRGERLRGVQAAGLGTAFAGLVVLVFPGLEAPSPPAAGLMAIAGIGWGIYSLRGRSQADALGHTAGNFLRTVPVAILATVLWRDPSPTTSGLLLAVASGALASGIGYAIWYRAVPDLTRTQASAVQLSVPALAALAGILLLGEPWSARLGIAAVLVLGGLAAVLLRPKAP